ncbi:MAG TPA: bacillithiol biosynthesis BshC, partial [Daejeonella sp.]|nr:bacillithiol biosynthesis BshC [Daejeonella sp.]
QELSSIFEKIKLRTYKIDPSLGPSSEAVKSRLQKAVKNLEAKLIKAEKRNFGDALSQIDVIKSKLFPNGGLQERSENFGLFYVKYGKGFIKALIENFKPLDLKFTILEE